MNSGNMVRGDRYTGLLAEGQAVYSGLYGGRYGYIKTITGRQTPASIQRLGGVTMGGSANLLVRFDSGIESSVPECIVRGVQWSIGGPADVAALDAEYEQAKAEREAAAKRKADEQARQRRELPAEYPYLETVAAYEQRTGKTYAARLVGAQNIRTELGRAFPGVKFSIKGKAFSGGDSIDVHWTDGPTSAEVDKIINKYQDSDFDGMEDLSRFRYAIFNELFGGAKYVHGSRDMSKATETALLPWARAQAGNCWYEGGRDYELARLIWRLVAGHSIPAGATVTGAEHLPDVRSGAGVADFYRLTFAG